LSRVKEKNVNFHRLTLPFTAILLFLMTVFASAEGADAKPAPFGVVESLTSELLDTVRKNKELAKTDPEQFYTQVATILESKVSFKFIAKNVMSEKYWAQATEQQRDDFVTTFKRSLVETYAKGMSQNLDFAMEILQDKSDYEAGKNTATIVQKITGPDSVNHIVYSMGRGRSGQWKVLNVVLDGVNLGKTFRSQFAQAVKENKGDIGATISGWAGADKAEVKGTTEKG